MADGSGIRCRFAARDSPRRAPKARRRTEDGTTDERGLAQMGGGRHVGTKGGKRQRRSDGATKGNSRTRLYRDEHGREGESGRRARSASFEADPMKITALREMIDIVDVPEGPFIIGCSEPPAPLDYPELDEQPMRKMWLPA